ncbi:MAG: hypothetical protein ABI658_26520 [Acidimicrobiales bacterium]
MTVHDDPDFRLAGLPLKGSGLKRKKPSKPVHLSIFDEISSGDDLVETDFADELRRALDALIGGDEVTP